MNKKIKTKIKDCFRKLHLLGIMDLVLFIIDILKNIRANKEFIKTQKGFIHPPHRLAFEEYNHTNWNYYYNIGLLQSELFMQLIEKHCTGEVIKICDWGCGAARIIRHMTGINKYELYGTDCNAKVIKWCKANVPQANFMVNNMNPPLPFSNEYFDCIYAYSVFTHISEELQFKWLNELFRCIKKNGILIFTTCGDYFKPGLIPEHKLLYESGEIVIQGNLKEGTKCFLSLHPEEYVRNKLLKDIEIIDYIKSPVKYSIEQDVWVVKKAQKLIDFKMSDQSPIEIINDPDRFWS